MKINKLYRFFVLTSLALFCFCNTAIAQQTVTELKAIVVDEQGIPINGVNIYAPNGVESSTDVNGQFQIKLKDDDSVVIQKTGYESEYLYFSDFTDSIVLKKSLFLATEDDEIKMGVITKNRREAVGAISVINTNDRLTYDNTQFVRDYINGLMLGVRDSNNIRGLGSAVFVIDGVIGRDPNILNMEEVDQITVLKDASAVALYGSQARNGVIVINTKRGKINRKEFNVNVRSGLRTPVALPNYLSSAAYMTLFNEAFINDGGAANLLPFPSDLITNTRTGLNPVRYPDLDLYSFVQPIVTSRNIITEFSGGNDKSQYYVNAGWNYNEAWVNINDDINAGTNRFNLRGNIDFKVNDWITSSIDGIAIISTNKSSRANLLNAATTLKPNVYSPFIPVGLIDTANNPTLAGQLEAANTFNGQILGTTQQFGTDAPVALAIAGGYQNTVFRSTQFNNSINFDLDMITEGLSAKTYLSFDFYDSYNLTISNQFRTYAVDPNADWNTEEKITNFSEFGDNIRDLTENVSTNNFISRLGFYGLINYDKTFGTDHTINSTFLGYYNSEKRNNVLQTDIDSHLAFQLAYDYKKKLFIDFSGSYVHSIKLPEGNRGGLSPTAGIAYVVSEESFLKESNFVNYLKLKASGGIIKSDKGINGYYLYGEDYSNDGTFNWADGQSSNRRQGISQGANPNLGYEERVDLNIGFESYLMNSLWIEFNYFKTDLDKQLAFLTNQYPSYYNTFRPLDNFNRNSYKGFEIGLNYKKELNDLTVTIGANILQSESIATKRAEINEFDYQNRLGKETSTIFGLVDQGFYADSDFTQDVDGNDVLIDGLPIPNFGAVRPGDIKYMDQNGDGIVDNDDRVAIGQLTSPFNYGINLNLKYKAFNLFILGTGQTGGDGNKLNNRFNNYYGVNGNDKYSEVVLGRWTPETADTATFPRLSTQNNQNNFTTSSFWLYDNSFFRINRAQLTFEFDENFCDRNGFEDFSLNIQGTNILELAKNKDIRQLNIGTNPQFKSYTLGLRMSF